MATRRFGWRSPGTKTLREAGNGPVETLKSWLTMPSGMRRLLAHKTTDRDPDAGRRACLRWGDCSCPYAGTIRIRFEGFPQRGVSAPTGHPLESPTVSGEKGGGVKRQDAPAIDGAPRGV